MMDTLVETNLILGAEDKRRHLEEASASRLKARTHLTIGNVVLVYGGAIINLGRSPRTNCKFGNRNPSTRLQSMRCLPIYS